MFALADSRASCTPMPVTPLADLGVLESSHLEKWVVDHPEVLGDDIVIVTTQYGKWSSDSGDLARERLDILGLDSSGQLVVVELKRSTDANVHLQALTYAALVAGFSKDTLEDAHAEYLNRGLAEPVVSPTQAGERLHDHVDGTWDDDLLTVPRIVLIAEDFTAQTYTTVSWLSNLTANLAIEMHTVNVFVLDGQRPCVVFRRLFPAVDPSTRVLTPGIATAAATSVVTKIAEKQRRIRSTYLLHDSGDIAEGTEIVLDLHGYIDAQTAAQVDAWISADERRGRAVWVTNRERPLRWAAGTSETYTPTGLAKHIIYEACGRRPTAIPGADLWKWRGNTLAALATQDRPTVADSSPN